MPRFVEAARRSRRVRGLRCEDLEGRCLLSTYNVNTVRDDSTDTTVLTLREAIELADGTLNVSTMSPAQQQQIIASPPGQSVIDFKMTQGQNYVLSPTSALPAITTKITIDGYSEPGASPATSTLPANITIILDGTNAGPTASGLDVQGLSAQGTVIQGLDFINWGTGGSNGSGGGAGIFVQNSESVSILGNDFGFTSHPSSGPSQNYNEGIQLTNSHNDIVGGGTPATRNVFRVGADSSQPNASTHPEVPGIYLFQETSDTIQGNYVGFDPSGNLFPNVLNPNEDGVQVVNSQNNMIGGSAPGQGNALSGIWIGSNQNITTVGNNVVQGNMISINPDGLIVYNAAGGANIFQSTGNVIGGAGPGQGNLIAQGTFTDNTGHHGIDVYENDPSIPLNTTIQGNIIGTDRTLTKNLNMYEAIRLVASGDLVGGLNPAAGNRLYDSSNVAIEIWSPSGVPTPTNNQLYSNLIVGSGYGAISAAPNQLNTPVINLVAPAASGAGYFAAGSLSGAVPGTTYTAQFFADDGPDTFGGSESQYFGATVTATARADGTVLFSGIVPASILKSSRSVITAMVSGPNVNTSQTGFGLTASATLPETVIGFTTSGTAAPGKAVTLGAVIATALASWVKPTGTVEFLDNGIPIGAAPVGPTGVALLTTASLPSGPHAITAFYQGDGLYPKGVSAPVVETILSPPRVFSAVRVNPTQVQVVYSMPMDQISAGNASSYQIFALRKVGKNYVTIGKPLKFKVSLDSTHQVVILKPLSKLARSTHYRLSISPNVNDAQGVPLGGSVITI